LKVTDNTGRSTTVARQVTVGDQAPGAVAGRLKAIRAQGWK
jgi:hypothetical protein